MNVELLSALSDLQTYAKPLLERFKPALEGAKETELDPSGCSGCPLCTLARERGADDEMVKKVATAGLALLQMLGQLPDDGQPADRAAKADASGSDSTADEARAPSGSEAAN
ncbi:MULTISPECIES: hypothetical protein [Antrihabitans]|uniref:Uncharacterized protein n=2 Tax=Antrihabitans TaxID=2799491 RepID=A0A934NSJ2_9NOCA|nr:hypothetical protein [Antrihabitans stalagmiti]MBJ8340510.1 hypothetical protein [Antrihabitans stalagmiti]